MPKSLLRLIKSCYFYVFQKQWHIVIFSGENYSNQKIVKFKFGSADPFVCCKSGSHSILFELITSTGLGTIENFDLDEKLKLSNRQKVITCVSHLSFPFVFNYQNKSWIMPESNNAKEIAIYSETQANKYEKFSWLLKGERWVDSMLLSKDNSHFLITNKKKNNGDAYSLELEIYSIQDFPMGDAQKLKVAKSCNLHERNAGVFFSKKFKTFVRVSQISTQQIYGAGIRLNKIETLTKKVYQEIEVGDFVGIFPMHHFSKCDHFVATDIQFSNLDYTLRRGKIKSQLQDFSDFFRRFL